MESSDQAQMNIKIEFVRIVTDVQKNVQPLPQN